jgi:hypothetical protein
VYSELKRRNDEALLAVGHSTPFTFSNRANAYSNSSAFNQISNNSQAMTRLLNDCFTRNVLQGIEERAVTVGDTLRGVDRLLGDVRALEHLAASHRERQNLNSLRMSVSLHPMSNLDTTANFGMLTSPTYAPTVGQLQQFLHLRNSLIPAESDLMRYSHHAMRNVYRPHGYMPRGGTATGIDPSLRSIPMSLPVALAIPTDGCKLSNHQSLLRTQIEAFQASDDDVTTHTRGRNKPIVLGQVGIRCKHCAHVLVSRRQKGAAYFPSHTLGIYQAAQNMSVAHIQTGACMYMPESIKLQFARILETRKSNVGAGRSYWAKSAAQLGLLDTENGIRFIRDVPPGTFIEGGKSGP